MASQPALDIADAPMTAPLKLVIFDFDGTLSDSGDWFLSIIDDLAARYRFRTVRDDAEVEMLRKRSSREVIDYLGIPRWKLPFIARHVRARFGRSTHEISLFPGTRALVERLASSGMRLAVVTSNAEENARRILGPEILPHIETFECGSSLFGKAPKFRRVLKRLGVAPHEALSIGDETRDIEAAREVGMRSAAVLWGYASHEALGALDPEAMFATPDDILSFVEANR
ncbi:MAG: HAD hydrolase-like protein [Pseudomonadota bacterium]